MTGRAEMTATASATPQPTRLYVYGVMRPADGRGWPGTAGIDGPPQPSAAPVSQSGSGSPSAAASERLR